MTKPMTRILVGLALLYAAWCSHRRSVVLVDEASGRILTKEEAPEGDLDFFGQPNPIKNPPTEAQMWKVREAQWMQSLGLLTAVAGSFLILLGVAPICFRVLVWLFIPEFMRRSHADPDRSGLPGDRPAGDKAGGEPEASAPDAA